MKKIWSLIFIGIIKCLDICDDIPTTEFPMKITTPGFPSPYKNLLYCTQDITVSSPVYVISTFQNINCEFDELELIKSNSGSIDLCKSHKNPILMEHNFTISFQSDEFGSKATRRLGFELLIGTRYENEICKDLCHCWGTDDIH